MEASTFIKTLAYKTELPVAAQEVIAGVPKGITSSIWDSSND